MSNAGAGGARGSRPATATAAVRVATRSFRRMFSTRLPAIPRESRARGRSHVRSAGRNVGIALAPSRSRKTPSSVPHPTRSESRGRRLKQATFAFATAPGAYTAQVSGVGGTTGVALVEVYEVP